MSQSVCRRVHAFGKEKPPASLEGILSSRALQHCSYFSQPICMRRRKLFHIIKRNGVGRRIVHPPYKYSGWWNVDTKFFGKRRTNIHIISKGSKKTSIGTPFISTTSTTIVGGRKRIVARNSTMEIG